MSNKGESDNEGEVEEKKVTEYYYYFSRETGIQADNERTNKIKMEKREREMKEKMLQDEANKLKEARSNKEKDKLRLEQERKKAQEEKDRLRKIKKEEEIVELQDLKGNFATTVLNIRANLTALEMIMTGTDYSSVQRRIIYKSLEKNNSIKVLSEARPNFLGIRSQQKIYRG
jgi:hypothetical protein